MTAFILAACLSSSINFGMLAHHLFHLKNLKPKCKAAISSTGNNPNITAFYRLYGEDMDTHFAAPERLDPDQIQENITFIGQPPFSAT